MNWLFYLDNTLIEEPVGFADIVLKIKRDDQWHGIFFEASTGDLQFYGAAATYLMGKKNNEGFQAEVIFKAVVDCGEDDEIFTGKLDFRQYKESCGSLCFVKIPVEQDSCIMTMRNRYDQKVDLSDQMAFDKLTVLPNYAGLNFGMELAAQDMRGQVQGYVADGGDNVSLNILYIGTGNFSIRPTYGRPLYESINQSELLPGVYAASDNGFNDSVLSPVLLLDDSVSCFEDEFNYEVRLKGSYDFTIDGLGSDMVVKLRVMKGEYPGRLTLLHEVTLFTDSGGLIHAVGTFDQSWSGSTPILQGDGFYAYFDVTDDATGPLITPDGFVLFDPETYVNIYANKSCPPTDAQVSLIHELGSRVIEAITDHCLTLKSDYYGRTDSEPYAAATDGCGSLRVLSNGLRIRNAQTQNHFISLKELFEGLNGIDNIGMSVEPTQLRIEPAEFFYQNIQIAAHDSIPQADFAMMPGAAYSIIKSGYKKWETENVNGLDEFNSNKDFRTSLKSINNTLDVTSAFIAGGYPIEHTREQSFADTGAADTKYDNDTFIICVVRSPYAYGNYIVEQGNIDNAVNFYSPATAYNWRIRPFYNLMRWWKSVAQSYVNLVNTASRLLFSAGTGNLLAEGELPAADPCKIETHVKAENSDLGQTDMATGNVPIWKPESMTYLYPMSLKDYNVIKSAPYGYISAQCGASEFVKGFITNINYRIAKGDADITLKLKWGT